jgi:hypothetical protein
LWGIEIVDVLVGHVDEVFVLIVLELFYILAFHQFVVHPESRVW